MKRLNTRPRVGVEKLPRGSELAKMAAHYAKLRAVGQMCWRCERVLAAGAWCWEHGRRPGP